MNVFKKKLATFSINPPKIHRATPSPGIEFSPLPAEVTNCLRNGKDHMPLCGAGVWHAYDCGFMKRCRFLTQKSDYYAPIQGQAAGTTGLENSAARFYSFCCRGTFCFLVFQKNFFGVLEAKKGNGRFYFIKMRLRGYRGSRKRVVRFAGQNIRRRFFWGFEIRNFKGKKTVNGIFGYS